jgi:hypothetical protein
MKLSDDTTLVICQRVSGRAPEVPSTVRQCSHCQKHVYVSHVTLARIEKESVGKPIVFACLECLPTYDVDLGDTMQPSPEQLAEIEAATGNKLTEEDVRRGMERFKNMYRRGRSERN